MSDWWNPTIRTPSGEELEVDDWMEYRAEDRHYDGGRL